MTADNCDLCPRHETKVTQARYDLRRVAARAAKHEAKRGYSQEWRDKVAFAKAYLADEEGSYRFHVDTEHQSLAHSP